MSIPPSCALIRPPSEIAALNPKGLILSGGPSSVYSPKAPMPDRAIFKLGVPILGICYGVQLMAHFLGGKVERGQKREYGKGTLLVTDGACALFANLPARCRSGIRTGTSWPESRRASKPWPHRTTRSSPPSKTARGDFSACNFIPKWSTRRGAARSSPISSMAFAAAARIGRCAITWTRRWRKSASRPAGSASFSV